MDGWIEIANNPKHWGHYWLLSSGGYKLLGHWGTDLTWRGTNCGGETFRVMDSYTHWTPVIEPVGKTADGGK